MNETVSQPVSQLEPGQYDTVIPVVDSTNGQPMALAITDKLPDPLPPVRYPIPLAVYMIDQLAGTPPLSEDQLTGLDAVLYIMKNASWRYDGLRKFVVAYADLDSIELHPERGGHLPSFEDACDLAGVGYDELVGLFGQACYWYGVERTKKMLYIGLPDVVKAAHTTAQIVGKEGHADRKLLMEAGELIKPNGPVVNVNTQVNNQTNVVTGLPAWDEVDKVLDIQRLKRVEEVKSNEI